VPSSGQRAHAPRGPWQWQPRCPKPNPNPNPIHPLRAEGGDLIGRPPIRAPACPKRKLHASHTRPLACPGARTASELRLCVDHAARGRLCSPCGRENSESVAGSAAAKHLLRSKVLTCPRDRPQSSRTPCRVPGLDPISMVDLGKAQNRIFQTPPELRLSSLWPFVCRFPPWARGNGSTSECLSPTPSSYRNLLQPKPASTGSSNQSTLEMTTTQLCSTR
jgi:hypothetical protein